MSRAFSSILILALALPRVASAAPPEGPARAVRGDEAGAAGAGGQPNEERPEGSAASRSPAKVGELSRQGTRRGALELGLGVVLAGAAAGLSAYGAVAFARAREQVEFCRESALLIGEGAGLDPCSFDPPPLGFASAGLSWGLSLPLFVGAGMLLVRGAQLAGDARRYRRSRLSLGSWWQRRGAGASLTLRF